jgi:hypothetical protein
MQCVKLFDIIPPSGKDTTLGAGYPVLSIFAIFCFEKQTFVDASDRFGEEPSTNHPQSEQF